MYTSIVKSLHEMSQLSRTPRSGFAFLGTGKQSVAEHSFGVAVIALFLKDLCSEQVNGERLLELCLVHDLLEARTGDLNHVNKKYVKVDTSRLLQDLPSCVTTQQRIIDCITEYEQGRTVEARLAHDADQLELLLTLRQLNDAGNERAMVWFARAKQRLQTKEAHELASAIKESPIEGWWRQIHDAIHQ